MDLTRFAALVRWRTIHFPVHQWKLLRILPENGYLMAEGMLDTRPAFGSSAEITGAVGHKGTVALILDANKPSMQLDGVDIPVLLDEFDELEALLSKELGFESNEMARFYEIDAQVLVWSKASPIETFRKHSSHWPILEKAQEVVGSRPLAPYSLKLVSSDSMPGAEDWFELTLEPAARSPETAYLGVLTFRAAERNVIWETAARVQEVFTDIAELVEAG